MTAYTRPAVLDPDTLPSPRNLRAVLGEKRRFTVQDFAAAYSLTDQQTRNRLNKLIELGRVEKLDETRPGVDADGQPKRGRPAVLYRIAS